MRENCTSGSVRGGGSNAPTYSAVGFADRGAAADMLQGMGCALFDCLIRHMGPVDALVFDHAHQHVDFGVQGIGCLEQAEQVLCVRCRDMANYIDGEKRVAVGVDTADRRHGVEKIQGTFPSLDFVPPTGTQETLCLFPSKAL